MTQKDKDIEACKIAVENSYLRCLYGNAQLAWVFFAGMLYGRTGEFPKPLFDDDFASKEDLHKTIDHDTGTER